MTEPKATPRSELRRMAAVEGVCPICSHAPADFDRLRDERDAVKRTRDAARQDRDRYYAEVVKLRGSRGFTERDEARRVAGVLADALRNAPCYCDHPLRAGLPPCSRCSALAVFDTLTEEKTDAP